MEGVMDLGPHHLRLIDAIAATSSISKGAARLGLSQPAVSRMLNRVERQLGVQLFTRTSGGVRVTAVGSEVVTRARAILAGLDDLSTAIAADPRAAQHLLRVGAQPSPIFHRISAQFAMLFPRAHVQLRVDNGQQRIVSLLTSGALDVGLILEPLNCRPISPPGLHRHEIVECEPAFVAMAARDPLAALDSIDLVQLRDREWIDDPSDDSSYPAYFRQACATAGFLPRVSFWTGDWGMIQALIKSQQAVMLFHPTSRPVDGITLRPLTGTPLAHRLVLLWRDDAASTARRMISALEHLYPQLVAEQPIYSRWWNAHPEAHPRIPQVAG
ncbi:LysR family transcriptional regulator [Pseudonocardiaceae bacterium YIM PH 21723]|nr:LysR family transcriptional regulator [Pseudonocardiaceae bacterium YIM PH 21723]